MYDFLAAITPRNPLKKGGRELKYTVLSLGALALFVSPRPIRADAFLDVDGVFSVINVPGSLSGSTAAFGINNLGQIVGGYYDSSGALHGFLDTNGIYQTIDAPGAAYTIAHGINDAASASRPSPGGRRFPSGKAANAIGRRPPFAAA